MVGVLREMLVLNGLKRVLDVVLNGFLFYFGYRCSIAGERSQAQVGHVPAAAARGHRRHANQAVPPGVPDDCVQVRDVAVS